VVLDQSQLQQHQNHQVVKDAAAQGKDRKSVTLLTTTTAMASSIASMELLIRRNAPMTYGTQL